jgi:hypothetical protein
MQTIINPISHSVLVHLLNDVGHPEQKIKYLKSKGILHSLIKGWYIYNEQMNGYSTFHIANLLYGPSYVTGLSVLSYLGWIADTAFGVQSMVFKRGKEINTTVANFDYRSCTREVFSIGIMNYTLAENTTCLMASPTKAMYDHIQMTTHLYFSGKNDLINYLEEDLRFDMDRLAELDKPLLEKLMSIGSKKRQIKILYNLLMDSTC